MTFDMSWDFRATAGATTDAAYGVPVLAEAYPHTYTNANGDSLNAGWTPSQPATADLVVFHDPRIDGANYVSNNGSVTTFQADLSSGSAPGAGDYAVDLAMGGANFGGVQQFKLKDTATVLIDGTNGGAGLATASAHFIDATLTDVAGSTTWAGTPVNKTFATTMAKLEINQASLSLYTMAASFRLTLQSSPPAGLSIPVAMSHYRQQRRG